MAADDQKRLSRAFGQRLSRSGPSTVTRRVPATKPRSSTLHAPYWILHAVLEEIAGHVWHCS